MNGIVKLLIKGLEEDPEDWSIRIELVGKVVKNGDIDIAESLLVDSPTPPPDDDTLIKVLQAIPEARVSILTDIAKSYINQHPSSAPAQYALAQLYLSTNEKALALEHYRVALAFDSSLRDPKLAQLMLDNMDESPSSSEPEPVAKAVEATEAEKDSEEGALIPVALVHPNESKQSDQSDFSKNVNSQAAEAPSEKKPLTDVVFTDKKNSLTKKEAENESDSHEGIALIVGDGETASGQDKESGTKEKISALAVSVLAHVVIFVLLALVIISVPPPPPPQLIVSSLPSVDEFDMEEKVIQKKTQKVAPPQAAMSQVNITSVLAISPVALPDVDADSLTMDVVGMGNTFGMSMSLADADGAGMVSFFGSRSKAQKVVFVVDSSASMKAKDGKGKKSKHQLMKEELIKTLRVLPPTVEFQIIFFSGPAWFVGEKAPNSRDKKDDWHQWDGKNFWHYKEGEPDQLPVGKYIKATPSKVRKVIKQIEETPVTFGTDWRAPLKMAMIMEPDIIYFMTDGAVGKHPKKPPVVKDVIAFNKKKSRAKINAICLMVPKATDMLADLAKGSRGDFTLVKEDGTIVRGKDVKEKK